MGQTQSRVAEPPAMSRSSAVRELSLRDYKFYAKLVPLCFAVSVLRTTTTTDDRQTDRRTDSVLPSQWLLDANSQVLRARALCASLFPVVLAEPSSAPAWSSSW